MSRVVTLLLALLVSYGILVTVMNSCHAQREVKHTNLVEVLADSVHVVRDASGTHYSKLAFASIPGATESKLLSPAQKQLMKTVKAVKHPVAVTEATSTLSYAGTRLGTLGADSILSFSAANDTLLYKLRVNVRTRTLLIDSLQVRNTATVVMQDTDKGVVATITNSNPAMATSTVESFAPAPKKPRTLVKILVAVGAGILAGIAISH